MRTESCSSCGAPVEHTAAFCDRCGAPVHLGTQPQGSLGVEPHSEAVPLIAVAPPERGQRRVCPRCGWTAPLERSRCEHCEFEYGARPLVITDLPERCFWVAVETAFRCQLCRHTSPLNHLDIDGAVMCLHCGKEQRFDPNQWWGALGHAHAVGDLAGPHAEGRFPSEFVSIAAVNEFRTVGVHNASALYQQKETQPAQKASAHHFLEVEASPGHPLCKGCQSPMHLIRIERPTLAVGCSNPDCDERFECELPALVAEQAPYVLGVLGDEHITGQQSAKLEVTKTGAVNVLCPRCTAQLTVTSLSTSATCSSCHATSRVSERILRRLGFEKPRKTTWWLLFQGPSKLRSKLERRERKALARDGQRAPHLGIVPKARSHASGSVPRRLLESIRPAPGKQSRAAPFATAALVTGALAIALFVTLCTGTDRDARLAQTALSLASQSSASNPRAPTDTAAPTTLRPLVSFTTTWSATVSRTTGTRSPVPGTACRLEAKIVESALDWVRVDCDGTTLYDRRTALDGTSKSSSTLFESPGPVPDTWRHALEYNDTGQRSGRSQITLNTLARQVLVFRDDSPKLQVGLDVDPMSEPRQGTPLFESPVPKPFSTKLVLESSSDSVPGVLESSCQFSVTYRLTSEDAHHCAANLECGALTLGTAPTLLGRCDFRDAELTHFRGALRSDESEEPEAQLLFNHPTATLRGTRAKATYTASFRRADTKQ